ncbi:MAG: hypothetical protein Q7W02_27850 [Candidatus Rokubacteria bacterium]|nr:hypothetical protein [Candidatus Rokubacteria bacterium]
MSLAGQLLTVSGPAATPSALSANSSVVDIRGAISSTSAKAFINVDPTIFTTVDFLRIVGGSLTVAGPLLTDVQGLYAVAGDFLSISGGGSLTGSSSSTLLQFANSKIFVGVPDADTASRFFALDGTGSNANLGGSLAGLSSGSVLAVNGAAGSAVLELGPGANLMSPSASPVLSLSGSTLSLGAGVKGFLASGGTATVGGALLRASGESTVLADQTIPFVDLSNATVNVNGALVRLEGGSILQSGGVKVTGGSLTADSLLSTDGSGNTIAIGGTFFDLSNTTATLRTLVATPDNNTDTGAIALALNQPALRLSSSTLTLSGVNETAIDLGVDVGPVPTDPGVAVIASGTTAAPSTLNLKGTLLDFGGLNATATQAMVQLGQTTVNQTGTTSDLIFFMGSKSGLADTMTGPLLSATNSTINTSGRLVHFNGGSLTSTTTSPFLFFDLSTVASALQMIQIDNGSNLSLKGALLSAQSTTFKVGDPAINTYSLVNILDGATVASTGTSPLLAFDASSFDGATILSVRRSPSTSAPSTLTLSGPLFSAVNGSSFNTSSLGLGAGCCSVVSVTQGGRLVATTTSPLVQISGSTVNAGPDAQSGGSIISLSDTFTNAPPAELVAAATMGLAGPLLSIDNSSTVTALFHLLRVGNSSLISTSPDALIQISGSTVTLGGTDPFTLATSAARLLNLSMSNSSTPASLTLSGPLFSAVNSTLGSTAELFGVFGGNLAVTGTAKPLISFDGGAVTSGATMIHVNGLSSGVSVPSHVELSDPLLSVTGTTINARGNLVRIAEGASLSSSTTSPLISFQGGSYTGGPFQSVTGASLLRMFSQVGQSRTSLSLAGPYVAAADATFISPDAPPFNIADGAVITSTGAGPFASFTRGSATTQSSFFNLDNNTSFGSPPTVGSGDPPVVSISGTLIRGTDTTFTTQNRGTFLRLNNGVSLTQTGTSSPLVDLIGSSPGSVVLRADGDFAVLTAASGRPAPALSLSGPLLNVLNGTLRNGDPTSNTNSFIFVADGAQFQSTGASPLLSFDSTSVDTAAGILVLRRSPSASAPSKLTLSGPLFSAVNGSSFNTTSLGFPGGSACCTGFFIGQGAQLSSTSTAALIQLANSTFSSGPDLQSGGGFFTLTDTGGFPGETNPLVAPSSVSLGGPFLSASGSTISALFSLLGVTRSSLVSTSTEPLVQLSSTSINLGGTDPFTKSPTFGFLLVENSATGGSNAPTTVSLKGPFLQAVNSTLTTSAAGIGVFNGASLVSSTASPFVLLDNTSLTTGAGAGGDFLNVSGLGGSTGTATSSASFNGPLLLVSNGSNVILQRDVIIGSNNATITGTGSVPFIQVIGGSLTAGPNGAVAGLHNGTRLNLAGPLLSVASTLTAPDGLANISNGGQLTVTGSTDPLVSFSGGSATVAGNSGSSMFNLLSTATAVDARSELTLGTDRPIQGPLQPDATRPVLTSLLETSGATVAGQRVMNIDTALLEATAPLLNLKAGSVMTSSVDAINLNSRANVSLSGSDLIRLDGSTLKVNSGSLVNVNASKLTVGGNLVNLLNGATLTVFNGPLITVSGGGFVNITGALIAFSGLPGNTVNVSNALPFVNINGIPVALTGGAAAGNVIITGTPIKNPALGTITPGKALIKVDGPTSKLTIKGL